jgi:hypothetical protein
MKKKNTLSENNLNVKLYNAETSVSSKNSCNAEFSKFITNFNDLHLKQSEIRNIERKFSKNLDFQYVEEQVSSNDEFSFELNLISSDDEFKDINSHPSIYKEEDLEIGEILNKLNQAKPKINKSSQNVNFINLVGAIYK